MKPKYFDFPLYRISSDASNDPSEADWVAAKALAKEELKTRWLAFEQLFVEGEGHVLRSVALTTPPCPRKLGAPPPSEATAASRRPFPERTDKLIDELRHLHTAFNRAQTPLARLALAATLFSWLPRLIELLESVRR